ncbi:MAG TPA: type II toxin-antitoxin system RelE/ParE family toxin [Candidatus Saccharimonadales bacterium]|nr:type II toxin-antitoxin system RelE/ParE family toxin [Candidatus Saccharimonadales bacterium]
MSWSIRYFTSERGEPLVEVFVRKQGEATISKIMRLFDLLELHGPQLGMPYSRYLGEGLYELRIRARNEVRIFYICQTAAKELVMLHAFNKRTQKLPAKDLALARMRQRKLTQL